MVVVLFGPPGAGKGTQAAFLAAELGVPQVATGDIFRRNLEQDTDLGRLAASYMKRGELVPDGVVWELVADRLSRPDCAGGVLLDGFPRSTRQAELLLEWLGDRGSRVDLVISLQVPDEVLLDRLSGRRTCLGCGASYHVSGNPPAAAGVCDRCGGRLVQRPDDAEETVRARLATYRRQTRPVLGWLRDRAAIADIDGAGSIDEVTERVRRALG